MRTLQDYEDFVKFLEQELVDVNLKELKEEFEEIQKDLQIISSTQGRFRFLMFKENSFSVYGLHVVGYDYNTQSVLTMDSNGFTQSHTVLLEKKFVLLLKRAILTTSAT